MIVALVSASNRDDLADEEDAFESIAMRINALIHAGHIQSQGDAGNWRTSEIKCAK